MDVGCRIGDMLKLMTLLPESGEPSVYFRLAEASGVPWLECANGLFSWPSARVGVVVNFSMLLCQLEGLLASNSPSGGTSRLPQERGGGGPEVSCALPTVTEVGASGGEESLRTCGTVLGEWPLEASSGVLNTALKPSVKEGGPVDCTATPGPLLRSAGEDQL